MQEESAAETCDLTDAAKRLQSLIIDLPWVTSISLGLLNQPTLTADRGLFFIKSINSVRHRYEIPGRLMDTDLTGMD